MTKSVMKNVADRSPNCGIKIHEISGYFKIYRFLAPLRLIFPTVACIPLPTFNQVFWFLLCREWACLMIFDYLDKIMLFWIFICVCFILTTAIYCVRTLIIASFEFKGVLWQLVLANGFFSISWKKLVGKNHIFFPLVPIPDTAPNTMPSASQALRTSLLQCKVSWAHHA